ncbi:MAG TPA: carboxymuconolactone decarboxylase family protein [Mycobacteriales bacterium]
MTATKPRLAIADVDATAYQAVLGLEQYARGGDLETPLLELVKIRASEINGCAFCLDMHLRDARERGEDQRRLDVLPGWHEVRSLYTEREQAALALTEAVTRIADHGVPDEVWDAASEQFSDAELVRLLVAIATINVWNRLAISTRQQPPDTD